MIPSVECPFQGRYTVPVILLFSGTGGGYKIPCLRNILDSLLNTVK
jgi:hypothetical protein